MKSRLSPQEQARHDKNYDAFKESNRTWQKTLIDAEAATPGNTHKETHKKLDPKGKAILAAQKRGSE